MTELKVPAEVLEEVSDKLDDLVAYSESVGLPLVILVGMLESVKAEVIAQYRESGLKLIEPDEGAGSIEN